LLEIEVWDKDTVSKNDMIAATTIALANVFEKKKLVEWY
jgi:hypothetical protein